LCGCFEKLNPPLQRIVLKGLIAIRSPNIIKIISSWFRRENLEDRLLYFRVLAEVGIRNDKLAAEVIKTINQIFKKFKELETRKDTEERDKLKNSLLSLIKILGDIGGDFECAYFLIKIAIDSNDLEIIEAVSFSLSNFLEISVFIPVLELFIYLERRRRDPKKNNLDSDNGKFTKIMCILSEYILNIFFERRLGDLIAYIQEHPRERKDIFRKIKSALKSLSLWERELLEKSGKQFEYETWEEISITSIFDYNLDEEKLFNRFKIYYNLTNKGIYPILTLVKIIETLTFVGGDINKIIIDWQKETENIRLKKITFNPTNPVHVFLGFTIYAHLRRYALEKAWADSVVKNIGVNEENLLLYELYKEYIEKIRRYNQGESLSLPFVRTLNNEEILALKLARYEQLQLLEWLLALKKKADQLNRPLLVIPNVRYAYFLVGSIKDILINNGIEIFYAGVSSEAADDAWNYNSRYYIKGQIFPVYILRKLLGLEGKRPIVVVLDGTRELYQRNVKGNIMRLPVALARTYIDSFIAINTLTKGDSPKKIDELIKDWRSKEYLEILFRQRGFLRFKEKLERTLSEERMQDEEFYRFAHFNLQGLPILLGNNLREWGYGASESEKKKLFPIDILSIEDKPTLILANIAFDPSWIDMFSNLNIVPAFWDDSPLTERIYVEISKRGAELISVLDEEYLPINLQFLKQYLSDKNLPIIPYRAFLGYPEEEITLGTLSLFSEELKDSSLISTIIEVKKLLKEKYADLNIPQEFIEKMLKGHRHTPQREIDLHKEK